MGKTKRTTIGIISFFAFSVLPMICFGSEKLIFGAVEDTPPFVFVKNGSPNGIAVDIFNEIKRRAGFEAVVKTFPARRMILMGVKGINDGFIQIYYDESRKSVYYSSIPSYVSVYSIFVKKGNESLFSGSRLEDLRGKTVGWNRGYRLTAKMVRAVEEGWILLEEANGTQNNLGKLVRGRVDCFINNHIATMYMIKELDLQEKISVLPAPFYPKKGTYMGIGKKGKRIKDKPGFMKKFNAALESIHNDGTADRIIEKYIQ